MDTNTVDHNFLNKSSHWDGYRKFYTKLVEYISIQSAVAVFSHSRSWEGKVILDAGAGSGRISRMYINAFMQPGASLYCTDFAPKMVDEFKIGFENSELNNNEKIVFSALEDDSEITVEKYDPEQKLKKVFVKVANGKSLPFSDESFDLMLSNHCLQYCGDARAHIKEAYRVLQKGGTMGVGVVGRKENSKSIFILADAMKENGVEIEYDSMMFLLGDEGHLKGIFEEEGFEVSKCFYHTMNISANKEEFLKFLVNYNPYKEKWDELSETTKELVCQSYDKLFDERYGENSENPCELEALILVAHKVK